MIEIPEAKTIANELRKEVVGKIVKRVLKPTKVHKFCWFSEIDKYDERLSGLEIADVSYFGIYVEINFDNKSYLAINDGVNVAYQEKGNNFKDYQLLIEFTDASSLVFTVSMYGGIVLHNGENDNAYYQKSKNFISPFSDDFRKHFFDTIANSSKISTKAFLATEQRFPGIGNGVLQDILFEAKINPKTKIMALSDEEIERLYSSTISVLKEMCLKNGRDTEKDIYQKKGGYITIMSKNTVNNPCPRCGNTIKKEAYLGGSVYYCPICQPIKNDLLRER